MFETKITLINMNIITEKILSCIPFLVYLATKWFSLSTADELNYNSDRVMFFTVGHCPSENKPAPHMCN